jgi:hypothetical protein
VARADVEDVKAQPVGREPDVHIDIGFRHALRQLRR